MTATLGEQTGVGSSTPERVLGALARKHVVWTGFATLCACYLLAGATDMFRLQAIIYLVAPCMAVAGPLLGLRWATPPKRKPLILLALACALFLAADASLQYSRAFIFASSGPYGNFYTTLNLMGFAVVGVAFLAVLGPSRRRSLPTSLHVLDTLILLTISTALWLRLVGAPVLQVSGRLSAGVLITRLAYPLIDGWCLCGVLLVFLGMRRQRPHAFSSLAAAALLLFLGGNLMFNFATAHMLYGVGTPWSQAVDLSWMTGYFTLGVASLTYAAFDDEIAETEATRPEGPRVTAWDILIYVTVAAYLPAAALWAATPYLSWDFWGFLGSVVVISVLVALRGVALASQNAHLAFDSLTDPLTGLFNHRFFHERVALEVKRANRLGHALSVVSIDLDGLNEVNQRLGLPKGDEALRQIAQLIRTTLRETDTVCRVGGDEYAVIMPETPSEEAMGSCERIRRELERRKDIGMEVSAGVASYPAMSTESEDLIRKAEGALYWAKLSGGNQVLSYDADVVEALSAEERVRLVENQSRVRLVQVLASLVDARDPYTEFHSRNVAHLAVGLCEHLGFDETKTRQLETAALLHDVGKVGIPDGILRKPGKLTEDEWTVVREHPALGAKILAASGMTEMLPWIAAHHERWDGEGYPNRLAGADIPVEARILALCDTYDAMTSDRPYREALAIGVALSEIRNGSGTQFDPHLAEEFVVYRSKETDREASVHPRVRWDSATDLLAGADSAPLPQRQILSPLQSD